MKLQTLILAATILSGPVLAQTTGTPGNTAPGGTSVTPMPGVNPNTGTTPDTGVVGRNSGTAAASGDRNQAVTTTGANAPQPARGRTSFTQAQARGRIEREGFQNVTGLTKDANGVWRGTAMRSGSSTPVWLDYKGNVGQTGPQGSTRPTASTGSNPPGTAAGRATDRTLGTNTTGVNPAANSRDGTPGNPPSTGVGRAVDSARGVPSTPDGTPGNPPGTAAGRAMDRTLGTNTTGANPAGTNATGTNTTGAPAR